VPKDLCFTPGMGLMEALSRFEFTLALLQSTESVARVADEMCLDARLEGIDTLEIRFAPQLHTGSTMAQIVDAALEGVHHRAGLILCGLYGEPPSILEALVDIAHRRDGVVGIDLAGGPAPQARYGISDYVPAFTRARALGLGRTVHAGEGRPVDEIRFAVDHLHAQRIGHGVTLLDDDALVDRVIERGITIEACPTSNWQTGIIDSVGSHPIKAWIDRGIRVNINTDNTLLSQVSLPEELARTADACGLSDGELAFTLECGHQAAFGR
jgi:adenosine deaminase